MLKKGSAGNAYLLSSCANWEIPGRRWAFSTPPPCRPDPANPADEDLSPKTHRISAALTKHGNCAISQTTLLESSSFRSRGCSAGPLIMGWSPAKPYSSAHQTLGQIEHQGTQNHTDPTKRTNQTAEWNLTQHVKQNVSGLLELVIIIITSRFFTSVSFFFCPRAVLFFMLTLLDIKNYRVYGLVSNWISIILQLMVFRSIVLCFNQ